MLPEASADSVLALVLHARVYRIGDAYFGDMPNLLDLLLALRDKTGRVVLCAPTAVVDTAPRFTRQLPSELEVEELPFYRSNVELIRNAPRLLTGLFRVMVPGMKKWDIVGGVAPSGFGLLSVVLAVLFRRRVFLLVRGNVLETLRSEHHGSRRRKALVLNAMRLLDQLARVLIRAGVPTFTFGPALALLYPGPRVRVLRGYVREAISGAEAPAPLADPAALSRLLYAGRLTGEKGVDVLIRSLALLSDHGSTPSLTIIGDGVERQALAALCEELGIGERVRFIHYVENPEELRRRYLDAGIVVLPSRTEGVPGVLLEAMSLGRAIVASDVGGIPAVIEHGRTGLLVRPDDAEALAGAITRLIDDPDLAFRLGAAAMVHGRSLTVDSEAETILHEVL